MLVLAVLAWVAALNAYDPDLYYASLQEDEYLEWATFWAFMGAAGVHVVTACRRYRARRSFPWFELGVAVFCFVVAMEEISWAQRLIGYRPPAYFLEHNFQQEFNVHNVFDTDLRMLSLKLVIGGYGVVLPLIAMVPAVARVLTRIGMVAPPVSLVPAFAATYLLYETYPWKYSGEAVELMLGLSFLFAALSRIPARVSLLVAASGAVLVLGVANAALGRLQRASSPLYVEMAKSEAEALRRDFLELAKRNRGRLVTRCDLHKRVYSYERKYRKSYLYDGEFAGLTAQGMPEARGEFFLDPWNNPYWLRDQCEDDNDSRRVFVYSFGPNHRRDSSDWEIRADDVGAYIYRSK